MKLPIAVPAALIAWGIAGFSGLSVAQAQSMKPGLWEIQQKMGGNPKMDAAMAQMEKQLASMSPEQRKMMQDAMAKSGVSVGGGAPGGGMAIKMCVTKEMSDRNQMPSQQKGDCKTNITEKSANGMKMTFVCTNPPSSGEGVYTFSGDSAYTMKMKMNAAGKGIPEDTTLESTGHWVSGDCGSVKPVSVPAK